MPHYLRFVRVLALGSALASLSCDDDDTADETPMVDADNDEPLADADVTPDVYNIVDGPLRPPELPAAA